MSAKTEEATPRRLRKAREEGDSGASAFAAQAVAFLAAIALLPAAVRVLAARSTEALHAAIARAAERVPQTSIGAGALAAELLTLVLPFLAAVALVGGAAAAVQSGGRFATKKLAPKLSRLNPFAGMANLFSRARLFAVARALLGTAIVGLFTYRGLRGHVGDLARIDGRLEHVAALAGAVARGLAWNAAWVGLGLAALDALVVRADWQRRLRMTKDEVKREHKESEGDPQVKQARERAHHEMLTAATIGSVKTATVVVVNPTHLACALRYEEGRDGNEGDPAPVVIACGEGELARRILRAAEDYGVPVVRDVPLARALLELEVGDAIPEALYEAVAEILREVWDGDGPSAR